jgi:6-phosphogluconolactonase
MTLTLSNIDLEVLGDPNALADRVAGWMCTLAVAKDGPFAIALSGGSTPKALYEKLALPPYRDTFPWSRTHLFWGDERFVPHGDALSNYRMVNQALISRVPMPAGNVHAVDIEGLTPPEAARAYEGGLKSFYGADQFEVSRPLFDLVLLGLGPDGHTASLFPNTEVLDERDHWVAAVIGAKAEARITLTYPALASSHHSAFLVAGSEKQPILERLLSDDQTLPASRVSSLGRVRVFADRAAIGQSQEASTACS